MLTEETRITTGEEARACLAGLVSEAEISKYENDVLMLWRVQLPGGFSLWIEPDGTIFHGSRDTARDSAEVGG